MPPKGYSDGFGNHYDPEESEEYMARLSEAEQDEMHNIEAGQEEARLSARPDRETIIQADEITNLKIALNTTDSVDAFLAVA
jgi:hypothetical protein